jgi:hypothetical protein
MLFAAFDAEQSFFRSLFSRAAMVDDARHPR